MESEARKIFERMTTSTVTPWGLISIHLGEIVGSEVCVARTGVGKVMSAAATTHMIETYRPQAVIYTGIAGAIDSTLDIGDLVVASECLQHDVDATLFGFGRGELPYDGVRWLAADPALFDIARRYEPESGRTVTGRIVTGDQFCSLESRRHMPYLIEELDARAIDMEGAAAALVAYVLQTPFLHVRIISDKADGKAKVDFQRFLDGASAEIVTFLTYLLTKYRQLDPQ